MKLSEYLKKSGMSSQEYFAMQKRKEQGKTTLGDYQRQQRASIASIVDEDYIKSFYNDLNTYRSDAEKDYNGITFGSDVNGLYDKHSTAATDFRERSNNIRKYLDLFKSNIGDDSYKNLSADLDSFDSFLDQTNTAFSDRKDFFTNFPTKYDYDAYVMNNTEGSDNDSRGTRKSAYDSVAARLADIDKAMDEAGYNDRYFKLYGDKDDENYVSLTNERDKLKAELTKYEHGYKKTDELYNQYSANEDWAEDSTRRDLNKPTWQNLDRYGAVNIDTGKMWDIDESSVVMEDPYGTYIAFRNGEEGYDYGAVSDTGRPLPTSAEEDTHASQHIYDYNKAIQDGRSNNWELLDKEEVDLYYYLMNNGYKEEALSYIEGMGTELNRRATVNRQEKMEAAAENGEALKLVFHNIVSVPANIVGGATAFVDDAINMLMGNEINPYSGGHSIQNYAQGARTALANDIDRWTGASDNDWLTWGDAYQGLMSGVDSAVGALALGQGYTVLMGMGAAASEAKELYEAGASKGQIMAGGVLAGAAEAIFEKMSVGYFLDDVLGKPSKNIGQWVLKTLGQAGVEASEEFCTTIANYISDAAVRGSTSDWQNLIDGYKKQGHSDGSAIWQAVKQIGGEALHDAAVGAISGGLMGGVGGGITSVPYVNALKARGQQIIDDGSLDTIKGVGLEYAEELGGRQGAKLTKSANTISNVSGAKAIGAFSESVNDARSKLNRGDIESALIEKGLDKATAKNYTNVLVAMNEEYFNGNSSSFRLGTDEQWQKMTGDKNAYSVLSEIVTNKDSKANLRNKKSAYATKGIRIEEDGQVNQGDMVNYAVKKMAEAESKSIAAENHFDVSTDGKMINTKTGDVINVAEIASINDGEMILKLDNGDTVNANDVSFATEDEGLIYSAVLDMGVNAAVANSIVKKYNKSDGVSAQKYALGIQEAYRYGRYNIPVREMSSKGFSADLTAAQRTHAYNLGSSDAKASAEARQKAIDEAKKNAGNTKVEKGKVYFEGDRNTVTDLQKTSLETLDKLAESLGVSFYIYESRVENGKRVYTAEDGTVKPAPNGMYKTSDGSIHIDLNAGIDGKGTILFTAAHELVHYIKQWSPAKFKVLADFLMKQYGKAGISVDTLVKQQIAKAKRNGRTIDYDTAFEEVVADSMETMLADGKVAEKLALLKEQDKGLWNKIKQFFAELAAKIRAVYKGLDPNSREGKYVAEMKDSIDKIQSLFTEALVDASENYSILANESISNSDSIVFGNNSTDVGETESGVRNQLREHETIGDKATAYNNKNGNVDAAILATGIETMNEMAEAMLPFLDEEGILPPDIPGKTIFSNGSYGRTGENTTLCVRTLTYEDFKDRVSEKLGRPLTVSESLLVSQKIYDIATDPQCIYCYVAADRKAYDGYLGEYWNAMDKYIKALRDGGDSKTLYQEYLNGRKDTAQQQKRWAMWESIAKSGKDYISQKDIATKRKRDSIIAKKDAFSNQVKDAQRYAQSASWAKTVYDYRAYKGDILRMTSILVETLNSEYGLRMYSFSDYTPAFIVENMQMIIDASVKGLKSLAYTKDTDYVEIFAPTGQAINVSCFAKYDKATGTYVEDSKQGANWEKTKALRGKFGNVGAVMVCTNDAMVKWALEQDWVDVVIPYHIVKTGTTIANEYGWNNYTSESSDKSNGRAANIYPTEHNNDFATYSQLVNERDITPRFSRWYDMVETGEITADQYMKLVNEVRLPASELNPVTPSFDLDAAKRSFGVNDDGSVIPGGFVAKGGYMGGWYRQGVDVNQEVMQVSKDIKEGKTSLDVDYGMSKESKARVADKYGVKFSERDYPIDAAVEKTVNNALTKSNSTMNELSDITAEQNKAINKLVNQTRDNSYRGKYEGGKHKFSDTAIRHIMSEHGDFLREGLRAQLPMRAADIARHLSAIKDNKAPSSIKPTRTAQGTPSILTSYEVNGYTLYAEEITKSLGRNLPSDLIGHTMYKAPTLSTAAFYTTSVQTQPKRQSQVLCNYNTPNNTNLSTGNFIADANGSPALLNYVSINGIAKQDARSAGLIAMSADQANLTDKSGAVSQGYVLCEKPYYITHDHRVFDNSKTNVAEKINELKKQGYDCFIFDKVTGDNYMVAVVNKAQIVNSTPTKLSDRDSSGKVLTEAQQEFFKDSKVRDADGNLMPVYHGTPTGGFTTFEMPHYLSTLMSAQGAGFYFTDKQNAKQYMKPLNGKTVDKNRQLYEVYLNITNPMEIEPYSTGHITDQQMRDIFARGNYKWGMEHVDVEKEIRINKFDSDRLATLVRVFNGGAVLDAMKDILGYDGVRYTDQYGDIWVAWEQSQIKNTTNTKPTADPDIRYSDRYDETIARAKEYFGTTTDFEEAGFILPNGEMLKFTDDNHRGERQYDHRAIGIAYGVNVDLNVNHGFNEESEKHLVDFVNNGGIRFDPGSFDLDMDAGIQMSNSVPITAAQERTIRDFVEWKKQQEEMHINDNDEMSLYSGNFALYVDFGANANIAVSASAKDLDAWGVKHLSYEGGQINADRIIADIRHYYRTGETRQQSAVAQFLYQDRDSDAVSNRSLLANALESTIDTSTQEGQNELRKLNEYKDMVATLDEWSAKLTDLRSQLFNKGTDGAKRKQIQEEATKLANRISIYDKKLLTLEASKPLKRVLDREKLQAVKRQKQKDAEVLKAYRDRAEAKLKKQAEHYQESRKNAVEGRRKTAMKQSIKRVVNRLNSLLNKGTKERNVKTGLRDTVASALAAAEILFDSNVTNDDIVRNGIDFATEEDSIRLNRYRDLLEQRDSLIGQIDAIVKAGGISGTSNQTEALYAKIDRIDAEISKLNKELAKVFEMERARINRATVSSAIDGIASAYESIKHSEDDYIKNAYDEFVAIRLGALKESVKGTLIRDMTLEQLTELHDALTAIAHTVANANTYFRNGKAEDLAKLVSKVQEQILSHHKEGQNDPSANAKKPIDFAKEFAWNEMKPVTAFEALGSDAYAELFWDAIEAEGKWAKFMEEAKGFLDKQRDTYGYKSWDMESVHEFDLLHGKKFKLTLQDMMSIYAYSKREQAYEHMTAGGFQFDERSEYKDKDGTKRVHLTGELYATDMTTISRIVAKLDTLYGGKVTKYVDAVQAYLTELGSKGNEVSNILYGIDIFNEKAYFPLMSAKDYRSSVEATLNSTQTQVSLKNTGMTKQTVPHAKNPIILQGFDGVVEDHIKKMADYCTQVLPIENLRRVFDSVSLADYGDSVATKAIIEKVFGTAAKKYFDQYITDLNGGTFVSGAESPTMKMFSKFKGTAVSASLSVIVQQPFAVTRAMAMIAPKHFILGKISKPEGMRLYEEIKKYAPVAIIKEIGGFDVGSGRTARDYLGTRMDKGFKRVVDEVNEKAMLPAQKADELGWGIIWKAVKREVMSQGKFQYGTKDYFNACGKRFTEVIVNTQVYDSVNSRSGYMRSKSELVKFATSFMGEPTTVVNMAVSAVLKVQRATTKAERKQAMANLRRTTGTLIASTVLTTIAKSFIYAMRDDDDEEGFLERWAGKTGENLLSDINPFSLLPYTRDIVSLLEGWDVDRPDMTLFANVITSCKKMIKDGATAEEVLAFIGDMANIFGIPAKNLIRDVKAIINLFGDIFSGNI